MSELYREDIPLFLTREPVSIGVVNDVLLSRTRGQEASTASVLN